MTLPEQSAARMQAMFKARKVRKEAAEAKEDVDAEERRIEDTIRSAERLRQSEQEEKEAAQRRASTGTSPIGFTAPKWPSRRKLSG